MTRPSLTVDTVTSNAATHDTTIYSISQSPAIESKRSLESIRTVVNNADNSKTDLKSPESAESSQQEQQQQQSTPSRKASIRLMFSELDRRDVFFFLFPAIVVAAISGGLSPFMTVVLGQVFDAFSLYPISNASQSQKDTLLHSVGISCIELLGLAIASFLLGSIMSALWIATGERNVMNLRSRVYTAVIGRDLEWFDTKIGTEDNGASAETQGPSGVGGMMANFAKDTEDVRLATSMASGTVVQNLTSCIVCLIIAFSRSWLLTIVILSGVPVIVLLQSISQKKAGAAFVNERGSAATAATLADRAISAIATVKAFNAQSEEHATFSKSIDANMGWGRHVVGIWGFSSAMIQFMTMTMFVQAFWFGAKLVRSGTLSPGAVTEVFYACLIATASLQKCLGPLMYVMKGKYSMLSLLSIIDPPTVPSSPKASSKHSHMVFTPITPMKSHFIFSPNAPKQSLRRICPSKCAGELVLYDVDFAYPSRPDVPILKGANLFLPANDMTFIVGSSGSGKSTIAQLLARMYYPQDGSISLDNQDMAYLDEDWTRQHIALVSQSCILFDMTVHENVAMGVAGSAKGRRPEQVTREEVIKACTMALMHEFIRDLPNGYDTKLGTGGSSLSGGQKQRLAIARAILRDPTVLILDEATSALDVTSRVLVFEAVRACRAGKTTVVITHDLSQIQTTDFIYVLKDGEVFEQGYRNDLELDTQGEFYRMGLSQKATGGLPEKSDEAQLEEKFQQELERDALLEQVDLKEDTEEPFYTRTKHGSVGSVLLQPNTLNDLVDVVKDISGVSEHPSSVLPTALERRSSSRQSKRGSQFLSSTFPRRFNATQRRSSLDYPANNTLPPAYTKRSHRSLQFVPLSPVYSTRRSQTPTIEDDEDIILEKFVMDHTGLEAFNKRNGAMKSSNRRAKWEEIILDELKVESSETLDNQKLLKKSDSLLRLAREIYPSVPNKPWLFVAMLVCIASGAMTPIFSFILSRLTFEVSVGAQDTNAINKFGGIALALTATDGIFFGLKFFMMECSGIGWLGHIRKKTYAVILAQDKKWFDRSENSPVRLIQKLIKDGNDAQNIISMVLGQFLLVSAMMLTGLIWAIACCWQITLVGLGIAPVFAAVMSLQSNLVGRLVRQNKADREDVAKNYYESILNIRAIRSMNFRSVFEQQFESSLTKAHKSGIKSALIEGCTNGLASGLIYLAEAVLFIIGAILVSHSVTTFLQMLEALNLIVFSVTIGSQLMSFTQRVSGSASASRDFIDLMVTSTETEESLGDLQPALNGNIHFRDVYFSYPERPDVTVLQNTSLHLAKNECVAIVGASGSGKSTIACLLQRLYTPNSGTISIDGTPLGAMDVRYLRQQVSVVSQNPHLFDAPISENIAYGSKSLSQAEIEQAAIKANVHDFITSLPDGYNTKVGENASLISGGQAQRLQIARALARDCRILILDECTSALDPANEAAVLETIRSASDGRTTLMITHKLHTMKICDRILLVHQGAIVEEGTYDQLLERNGIFSQLARGGEWTSA